MVAPRQNLYEVLGVPRAWSPDASLPSIRAAYRKLAVQLHPDKGGTREEFAELQAAYVILCNVGLRQRYDETGKTDVPEDVRKGQRAYADQRTVPTPPKEEPVMCWKCGTEIPEKAKFCQECGAPRQAPAAKPQEVPRSKDIKVQLPPALQALIEGRTLESVPVPEDFEQPVAHITVTEKEGKKTLKLVDTYPMIENSRLIEGQVLVQMRAVPLTMSDLNADSRYGCGDIYGCQGIGQVRMVGPRVTMLKPGDWVLPLHDVDSDGDIDLDAMPPGTGRVLGVWKADRCAKLEFSADSPLSIANMALAKSIGAACLMVQESLRLELHEVLIQLLAAKGFTVLAVVRKHSGEDWIKQKLEGLGAKRVFLMQDDIRGMLEESGQPLPALALDGVGGVATNQLVQALSKTGDLVCFGVAGGGSQQAVTLSTSKKWKGNMLQFSFDEWLNRDVTTNAKILNQMLLEVTQLVKDKKMHFVIKEYTTQRFNMAVLNAKQIGRTHCVVLNLPRLEEVTKRYTEEDALVLQETSLQSDSKRHRSWDLDFLEWEDAGAEEEYNWRVDKEKGLFKLHPDAADGAIEKYSSDTSPTPIAQELGSSPAKAEAVLFWLPGRGEIPQEHAHWLERLTKDYKELRVLILEPHQLEQDLKWYDMPLGVQITDCLAAQALPRAGACHNNPGSWVCALVLSMMSSAIPEEICRDPKGRVMYFAEAATFDMPLLPGEIDALRQVECAALGLKRRAQLYSDLADLLVRQLEEQQLKRVPSTSAMRFRDLLSLGVVALYAAMCLMEKPIDSVAFCHSGIPAASMLGKRLTSQVRTATRLHAIYDKADEEIPTTFPDTLHQMLSLAHCKVSLYWLQDGGGHAFSDEAANAVSKCVHMWLDERNSRPNMFRPDFMR
ncbi:mecr [Symbiodinium pilosum]|uniref:Mecr protein n=1 Tax=Symbiodinium pilosum TaxID=2952 RepID=A0A812X389_SYMPI|nr:mecr [Symbiodinium pilosum]